MFRTRFFRRDHPQRDSDELKESVEDFIVYIARRDAQHVVLLFYLSCACGNGTPEWAIRFAF